MLEKRVVVDVILRVFNLEEERDHLFMFLL